MKIKRLLSLLLITAIMLMTLTGCGLGDYLSDILTHPQIEFDDLSYEIVKIEQLEAIEKELDELIDSLSKPYDVLYKLDEMFELLNSARSSETVLSIKNSIDLTDKDIEQKYLESSQIYATLYERCANAANKVTKSFCAAEAKEYWGEDIFLLYSEYTPNGDEYLDAYMEEQKLISEYNTAMMKDYSTTFKGNTISFSNIYTHDLTDEEYTTVLGELYKQLNDEVVPIYIKLIEVRREIAKMVGAESVAEDAYLNSFNREYSIEDVETVYSDIKEYIVPVYKKLLEESEKYDIDSFYYDSIQMGTTDLLYKVGEKIVKRFPEMKYAYNHMTNFGYYDVAYSTNKINASFTTFIPSVNTPFLFMNASNTASDMSTIAHEFGHYNAMYTYPYYSYDMDVSEIHSQALELLSMDIYSELTGGKYDDIIIIEKMITYLDSIIMGCIYNEFEAYAYNSHEKDVSALNKKMMSLMREYGIIDDTDERDSLYSWVETVHLYMYPFYYISYSVSAVSALDIYFTFLDNEKEGKELYRNIVASTDQYLTACQNTGVKSFFDKGVIKEIADNVNSLIFK